MLLGCGVLYHKRARCQPDAPATDYFFFPGTCSSYWAPMKRVASPHAASNALSAPKYTGSKALCAEPVAVR